MENRAIENQRVTLTYSGDRKAGDRRQETGDRRQETGDRRQETGRQETGRQETGEEAMQLLFSFSCLAAQRSSVLDR